MEAVGISPEGQEEKKPQALARGASFYNNLYIREAEKWQNGSA
jgi:hypothetical protein